MTGNYNKVITQRPNLHKGFFTIFLNYIHVVTVSNRKIIMARPHVRVISALRATAAKLEVSQHYQWGHMGACNCGYLAQQVTQADKAEIHRRALQRSGDWSEQLNDYCPTSGLPFDEIVSSLLSFGFDIDDLKHLERLSHPSVLAAIPRGRYLRHNVKADVILYLRTWADLLESEVLKHIKLPEVAVSVAETSLR